MKLQLSNFVHKTKTPFLRSLAAAASATAEDGGKKD